MFTKKTSKCHKERLVDLPPEVFETGTQAGLSFSSGFHDKLHGLVKSRSMLASITGEYEIANHKNPQGSSTRDFEKHDGPGACLNPSSPAGRMVIPKFLRGPLLTFIVHCN